MILSTWYYHICAHETLRIITHVNISSATKPNGINIRLVLEWNVIWALYGLMSCQFTPSVHLTGSWYYPFFTCIIPTMLWYMRIMNGELHMDLLVTWPKREDADCDIESCDIEVYNNYYTPKCFNMVLWVLGKGGQVRQGEQTAQETRQTTTQNGEEYEGLWATCHAWVAPAGVSNLPRGAQNYASGGLWRSSKWAPSTRSMWRLRERRPRHGEPPVPRMQPECSSRNLYGDWVLRLMKIS